MKKALLILLLLATSAFAQDWAKQKLEKSPCHREWVNVKNGDRTISAFVVYPEVKTKAPAGKYDCTECHTYHNGMGKK